MQTRWAILGPGEISGWFARALPRSEHGVLYAVGSSDPGRAAAFAQTYGAPVSGTYDEVLSCDEVDAVYVGTVHTTHAQLAIDALRAGKAVLCEKPATPDLTETERVLAVAAASGRPFLEAFKTSFGPFADTLRALVAEGAIGAPVRLESSRGGIVATRGGRLFDPALAGGAILDVGCYPVSLAVEIAGAAGLPLESAAVMRAEGVLADTGVDEDASVVVDIGGFEAHLRTSFVTDLPDSATLVGTAGTIDIPDAWADRLASPRTLILRRDGAAPQRIEVPSVDPLATEADAVSAALAEGRTQVPEFSWSHTLAASRILTEWLAALRA